MRIGLRTAILRFARIVAKSILGKITEPVFVIVAVRRWTEAKGMKLETAIKILRQKYAEEIFGQAAKILQDAGLTK